MISPRREVGGAFFGEAVDGLSDQIGLPYGGPLAVSVEPIVLRR